MNQLLPWELVYLILDYRTLIMKQEYIIEPLTEHYRNRLTRKYFILTGFDPRYVIGKSKTQFGFRINPGNSVCKRHDCMWIYLHEYVMDTKYLQIK